MLRFFRINGLGLGIRNNIDLPVIYNQVFDAFKNIIFFFIAQK